jgi:hypothetical protein
MTGEPDLPPAEPSEDRLRTDVPAAPNAESMSYDDFLKEVNRMGAEREAASRRERDARMRGLVALGIALAALVIALAALALAAMRT